MFDQIQEAKEQLQADGFEDCKIGIVLGTGLGSLLNHVVIEKEVSYDQIPHFPVSTVEFHKGRLVQGSLAGRKVILMEGRMHFYEGYPMDTVAFPLRVFKAMGVETVILSGAAGAMELSWSKGDLMMIRDHINLQPSNPLIGPNDDRLGVRFLDMSEPYSKHLQEVARSTAKTLDIDLREGVYVSVPGPMLESPAEYRYLHRIGADAVGMSTVPEVIAAKHMGLDCFGVSIVSDLGVPGKIVEVTHEMVQEVASAAEPKMTIIMTELIASIEE